MHSFIEICIPLSLCQWFGNDGGEEREGERVDWGRKNKS